MGALRIERSQLPHDARVLAVRRRAHDHESPSTRRARLQRFAQIPSGKTAPPPNGFRASITTRSRSRRKPRVLESVVEQEDSRAVFFFQQAAGNEAVGANARVRVPDCTKIWASSPVKLTGAGSPAPPEWRFRWIGADIRESESRDDDRFRRRRSAEMIHHGGLAGPAHADAANADHGRGQTPRARYFAPLLQAADRGPDLRERPEQESRRAQLAPARNGQVLPAKNFGHGLARGAAFTRGQRRGASAELFAQRTDRRLSRADGSAPVHLRREFQQKRAAREIPPQWPRSFPDAGP